MTIANLTSTDEKSRERSAGFVIYHEGKNGKRSYLLLRHRAGRHWGFPKGRIEPGEDEEAAAVRETSEETGIEEIKLLPGMRVVSRYRFARNNRPIHKEVAYFLGRVRTKHEPCLSAEHTEGKWLSCAEARQTLTYSDARAVLRQAERFIIGKR